MLSVEARIGRWSGDTPVQGLPVDVVAVVGTSWAGEPGTSVHWVLYGAGGGTLIVEAPETEWYGERGLLQTIVARVEPADDAEAAIADHHIGRALALAARADDVIGHVGRTPPEASLSSSFMRRYVRGASPLPRRQSGDSASSVVASSSQCATSCAHCGDSSAMRGS